MEAVVATPTTGFDVVSNLRKPGSLLQNHETALRKSTTRMMTAATGFLNDSIQKSYIKLDMINLLIIGDGIAKI